MRSADEYVLQKHRKYHRWVTGTWVSIGILLIGLIVSSIMYYYWRFYISDVECGLFCLNSMAVSLAFILICTMCLLMLLPIGIFCVHKLHKLNKATINAAVAAAVNITEGDDVV